MVDDEPLRSSANLPVKPRDLLKPFMAPTYVFTVRELQRLVESALTHKDASLACTNDHKSCNLPFLAGSLRYDSLTHAAMHSSINEIGISRVAGHPMSFKKCRNLTSKRAFCLRPFMDLAWYSKCVRLSMSRLRRAVSCGVSVVDTSVLS